MTFTIGEPPENIMTGIFAFELGDDFSSTRSVVKALKRRESQGKKPVDFVCINQRTYIAYNRELKGSGKGIWQSKDGDGNATPLPLGYVEVDISQECVFRMVLTLSTEARKNIATAVNFQPYFLEGWEKS